MIVMGHLNLYLQHNAYLKMIQMRQLADFQNFDPGRRSELVAKGDHNSRARARKK